jgi:hypothetical protein
MLVSDIFVAACTVPCAVNGSSFVWSVGATCLAAYFRGIDVTFMFWKDRSLQIRNIKFTLMTETIGKIFINVSQETTAFIFRVKRGALRMDGRYFGDVSE